MKKHYASLFIGSALVASLLAGCGETASDKSLKQPTNTTKSPRATGENTTDWTWFVDTHASFKAIDKAALIFDLSIDSTFAQGIPEEVKHLQYFIDTDDQKSTGFSYGQDSWEISGADYLVEDGDLYKSLSNTEWKWEYIASFDSFTRTTQGGKASVHMSSSDQRVTAIIDENKLNNLNISIEPFNENWGGIYSTISTQVVPLENVIAPVEITDAYMRSYIAEQPGDIESLFVSEFNKMAVVRTGSALDVYDFQATDRPTKRRIQERDVIGDPKIVGALHHEEIIYRVLSPESGELSIVNYSWHEKKVLYITVISGGAKDLIKANLSNPDYFVYQVAPNRENAIVTIKNNEGFKVATLYDVRDAQNPVKKYGIFSENANKSIRKFRIADNRIAEFFVMENGITRTVRYDYIAQQEIDAVVR